MPLSIVTATDGSYDGEQQVWNYWQNQIWEIERENGEIGIMRWVGGGHVTNYDWQLMPLLVHISITCVFPLILLTLTNG